MESHVYLQYHHPMQGCPAIDPSAGILGFSLKTPGHQKLAEEHRKLSSEHEKLNKVCSRLREKKIELDKRITSLLGEKQSTEDKIEDLRAGNQNLKTLNNILTTSHQSELKSLNDKIGQLQNEINDAKLEYSPQARTIFSSCANFFKYYCDNLIPAVREKGNQDGMTPRNIESKDAVKDPRLLIVDQQIILFPTVILDLVEKLLQTFSEFETLHSEKDADKENFMVQKVSEIKKSLNIIQRDMNYIHSGQWDSGVDPLQSPTPIDHAALMGIESYIAYIYKHNTENEDKYIPILKQFMELYFAFYAYIKIKGIKWRIIEPL